MGRVMRLLALVLSLVAATAHSTAGAAAVPVRAAYFYHYMPAQHIDSLAAVGFNRAIVHWISDSLGTPGAIQLPMFMEHGERAGIDVVPQWALQARARLERLPTKRRYTWGSGKAEPLIGCPLDSLFWRSTLVDRANEFLAVAPGARRLAVDLEIYFGSRHHYDAGPCRCAACVREYIGGTAAVPRDPRRLSGLLAFQEARLGRMLAGLLAEFGAAHPGVEIGVFDLDYDSFVHRAFARALARSQVPAANYCERTYGTGGGPVQGTRSRLARLGLPNASLVGGLWLKRWTPADLPPAARSILQQADGYFVFTTYSLWGDPARLAGPYTLLGTPSAYWSALRRANETVR